MMPVLQIGPLAINFPLLILVIGLWFAFKAIEKKYTFEMISASKLIDGLIMILIGAVIGARVGYLMRFPSIFLQAPSGIFSLSTDLLDPWGALVVSIVMMIRFLQREHLTFEDFLLVSIPFAIIMLITFSLMSFLNLEGFGTETTLPWAVWQTGAHRHPYQIYYIILLIGILFGFDRLYKKTAPKEQLLGFSLFLLGLATVFAFGFQADANSLLNGIRTIQIIGFVMMGFSVWLIGKK